MNGADPEGMTLLGKVLAAAGVIVAPIVALFLWLDRRYVHRDAMEEALRNLRDELQRRRNAQLTMEELLREHQQREQDRTERFHAQNQARFEELQSVLGDLREELARLAGMVGNRGGQ